MEFLNLVGDGEVFFFCGPEDDVGVFDAEHLLVRGDDDDVELVNLVELGGFGFGGSGHTGEFFVHAEIVLEGDGRKGLVFLADADAFFCLDGLVESVGPAAAGHEAAGELVDDDDFSVFDDVFDIALVEVVGLDGVSTWCLRSQFSGSAMLPMPSKLFDLLPASSVTVMALAFSSTT